MNRFHYKAYDEEGKRVEGVVAAKSRKDLAGALRSRGLHPIHIAEAKERRGLFAKAPFHSRKKLALLSSEWASLLDAGLLLTDSLKLLAGHRTGREKDILLALGERISAGHPVWESVSETGVFPPFFISMIQVGEMTGTLPEELAAASLYYRKEDAYIKKLQSTLAYPAFVLTFAFAVLLVILLFILPSFETLFETLGIPLPAGAAAGLAIGGFLRESGSLLALVLFLALGGLLLYGETEKGKEARERFLYQFTFYRRMLLIRFALSLSAFLESGKTLSESLADAGDVVGNPAAKSALARVRHALERGEAFPKALKVSGFSLPIMTELSRVGMESGELPKFLRKAAELMGEETEEKLRRFRAILEPALLLFVGALTAFVIFSVMLPVFEMAGRSLG